MPTPHADGPDIAARYQTIVGPPPDGWTLFSLKWCEGQQTEHFKGKWREQWSWLRDQPKIRYRGGYHYLRSDSTPKAQADFALRLMKEVGFGRPGDIWQADWEVTDGIPLMTSDQLAEYVDRVRQGLGQDRVIVYSSDWLPDSTLDADSRGEFFEWRDAHPDDAYWHANYNTGDAASAGWAEIEKYDADVWQWTSAYRDCPFCIESHVNDGGIDMNHIRNSATLDRIAGYATDAAPATGGTVAAAAGPAADATPAVDVSSMRAVRVRHPKYSDQLIVISPSSVEFEALNASGLPYREVDDGSLGWLLGTLGLTVDDLTPHGG